MCRVIGMLVLALLFGGAIEPLHADGLVKVQITTDRDDAVYEMGQEIVFSVQAFADEKPIVDQTVPYLLSVDGYRTLSEGTIALQDKPVVVKASLDVPGFVTLSVNAPGHVDSHNRPQPAMGGAAVAPQLISPSTQVPKDFASFWESKIQLVLASPMHPVLTEVPSKREGVLAYDLQLNCPDGQGQDGGAPVSGYFALPANATASGHPALLLPHSAGVKSANLRMAVEYGARYGLIALDFNAHGIPNGQPNSFYADLQKGKLKSYTSMGREERENSYFLGMYMRLYRALQYLKSRPEWDGKHLLVYGASQGGGQALVAAGLDSQVTFVQAGVPAMCDRTGPLVDRVSGWPHLLKWIKQDQSPKLWQQVSQTVRYFDAAHFAKNIHCQVNVSVGFCDVTCPPTTVYAAYNAIASKDKQIFHGIDMGHSQNEKAWSWFHHNRMQYIKQTKEQAK